MSLKSISLGNPCCLNNPLECSFKSRYPGHTGSEKKISMSCIFDIDFQLENSLPQ